MSTTSRYIYIHRWDCTHEEAVNGTGDRVDPGLVFNPDYTPIKEEAGYPCPACSDPDAGHPYIAIKVPRPVVDTTGSDNIPNNTPNDMPNTNHALILHPSARPFVSAQTNTATQGPANIITYSQAPPNAPTGPRVLSHLALPTRPRAYYRMGPHQPGHACPEGVTSCHFHHSGPKACHKPVGNCEMAFKAIRSSFYASNKWTGAPLGWNEAHEACIREENPFLCVLHERFQRDKDLTVKLIEQ